MPCQAGQASSLNKDTREVSDSDGPRERSEDLSEPWLPAHTLRPTAWPSVTDTCSTAGRAWALGQGLPAVTREQFMSVGFRCAAGRGRQGRERAQEAQVTEG